MWRRVRPWFWSAVAVVLLLPVLCGASVVVTIPLMLALSLGNGGSAVLGYEEGGAYFVAAHGESHEVSAAAYRTSLAVERAVFAGVACLGVLGSSPWRPRCGGGSGRADGCWGDRRR